MDTAGPRPSSTSPPSTRWSVYVGVYGFLCSTVLPSLLSPVSDVLVKVLAFRTDYAAFVLAGPSAAIGAAVWWAVVERRNAYTYLRGGAVGLLTALATVLFVLAVVVPAAVVGGIPAMYVRRRLEGGLPDGDQPAL